MLIEITNQSADVDLYQWRKVQSIDGVCPDVLYICFVSAHDLNGNKVYVIPSGVTVIAEVKYSDTKIL